MADALGVNHQLKIINKRDTSGLNEESVRRTLTEYKPDFVYIHLGVNDINQNFDIKDSLDNFCNFILFRDTQLPSCKLFLSLPLLTGDPFSNERIN
jgi:hypothetical protein